MCIIMITIAVEAFRAAPRGLEIGLEDLKIKGRIKTIQTTALLRLTRIPRTALLSLRLQRKTTNPGMKNLQEVK